MIMPPKGKYKTLSYTVDLCDGNVPHDQIANKFQCSRSVVSNIFAKRDMLKKFDQNLGRKSNREGTFVNVDKALLEWFTRQRDSNTPITGPMLAEKVPVQDA